MATNSKFEHYPITPKSELCLKAYWILRSAHSAASSFLNVFTETRKNRNAKGTPKDDEQDLLRAMLVFAASGLDSMIKQLIEDALPSIIDRIEKSHDKFKEYVERKLTKDGGANIKLISEMFVDKDPRSRLISILVNELTSQSLQSTDQLLKAGAYFDIPSEKLVLADDKKKLADIFRVRNEIVHEMDMDFNQTNRSRQPRARDLMIGYTNEVLCVANKFLVSVDAKIKP